MSTYKELFSLNLMHDYYSDGKCPDFTIAPTPECRELLEDHRIVFKNKITGIQLVVATTDGTTPFIDISDIPKFTFYMKLNESAFGNYTNLQAISKSNMYAYDNQEGVDELTSTSIKKTEVTPPVNDTTVFGVIDIYAEQLSDLSTPSQYTISFTASALNWSYYFITNQSDHETEVYHKDISFSAKDIADDDLTGQELINKYPDDSEIRLYCSDNDIIYQQQGIKNIEFRVTDRFVAPPGNPETTINNLIAVVDTLIAHLPNPSIYDNGIKILKVIL